MNLTEQICSALDVENNNGRYSHPKLYITKKADNHVHIQWGMMYEAPTVNFSTLSALGRLFGTENINVDRYSQGGCESCDWGSDYGHEIDIKDITLNLDKLDEFDGKNVLKEK